MSRPTLDIVRCRQQQRSCTWVHTAKAREGRSLGLGYRCGKSKFLSVIFTSLICLVLELVPDELVVYVSGLYELLQFVSGIFDL